MTTTTDKKEYYEFRAAYLSYQKARKEYGKEMTAKSQLKYETTKTELNRILTLQGLKTF